MAIGLLTIGMLMTDGVPALQKTTVIMGLPFSFVIFFVMAGLYKSLRVEDYRKASALSTGAGAGLQPRRAQLETASVAGDELPGHPVHAENVG